jgi:hypothetical protein
MRIRLLLSATAAPFHAAVPVAGQSQGRQQPTPAMPPAVAGRQQPGPAPVPVGVPPIDRSSVFVP